MLSTRVKKYIEERQSVIGGWWCWWNERTDHLPLFSNSHIETREFVEGGIIVEQSFFIFHFLKERRERKRERAPAHRQQRAAFEVLEWKIHSTLSMHTQLQKVLSPLLLLLERSRICTYDVLIYNSIKLEYNLLARTYAFNIVFSFISFMKSSIDIRRGISFLLIVSLINSPFHLLMNVIAL